jgi:hypothetical protein
MCLQQHCDGMILHAYIFMDDGTMPALHTDNCYIIVLHFVIRDEHIYTFHLHLLF